MYWHDTSGNFIINLCKSVLIHVWKKYILTRKSTLLTILIQGYTLYRIENNLDRVRKFFFQTRINTYLLMGSQKLYFPGIFISVCIFFIKKSFPLFKYISDPDDYRYHIYLPDLCSLLYSKDNPNNSHRHLCYQFCGTYRIDEKIRLAHLSNIK